MKNHRKIILIGPMGAGKTSLGKRLAQHFNWKFVDTDQALCEKVGANIPTLFANEGEAKFRQREHETLAEVLKENCDMIVASGGGIVLLAENRRLISAQSLVIFLDVSVECQIQRIQGDKNRPLAQVENLSERLMNLREERLALYEGLADISLNTDTDRFNYLFYELVNKIEEWFNRFAINVRNKND